LVGDVHQPLHCTARVGATQLEGDDGGNGVELDPGDNLHSFWDGVLGKGPVSTALNAASNLADPPANASDDLNVDHWIDESFNAAKQTAYKSPPIGAGAGPFTLTQGYKDDAKALAKERVALAGARLAKILNAELK